MRGELRKTGIDIIGNAPWGTHFCQFYQNKEDLIDILVPYFKAGLRGNEFCMWVTSEPLGVDEAKEAMIEAVPDFDSYMKKGQIEIIPYTKWYLQHGTFDSQRVLDSWIDKLTHALAKGFDGLRLTGNTFWLEKQDWRKFADYEEEVNNVIGKHQMIALCTYSLDKCGANEVIDVVSNHRFALIKREGKWNLIESFERKRIENALHQSEERFKNIFEQSPIGIEVYDSDGQLVEANKACLKMFGVSDVSEVKGFQLFDDPNLSEEVREKLKKGETVRYEAPFDFEKVREHKLYSTTKSGMINLDVLITPLGLKREETDVGYLLQVQDITEHKQAEETLRNAFQESRQRQTEISFLLEGSRAVLEYHEFKEAAHSIFDSCKKLIGATAGYIALLSKDGKENEVLFLDSGGLPCTVNTNLPMPIRGLREEVYQTNQAVYHNDFSKSEYMAFMPEGHARLINVLFAPLVIQGKTVGLLGLANKPEGFTENDTSMATAFGELISIALRNSRTFEALEHNEARFRSVVETAGDAIISIDSRGNIIFWNRSAEAIFGYSADEMTGKPLHLIMPERFRGKHINGIHRMATTGEKHIIGKTVEMVGIRKDRNEFPLELSLASWETKEGVFITGIIRDITRRKKMEEELRKSRDELEIRVQERTAELAKAYKELEEQSRILDSFFKHTITPLVLLDKNFNFIRVNEAYAKACQRDVSEFPGHNHFEFYPSDAKAVFEQVVETKIPYQAVARPFIFPDHPEWGTTYWNWTLTPILKDRGEVEFLVFSLEDVTKRKRAEDAVKAERQRFHNVLEMLPAYVVLLTPDYHVPFANRIFRERFGESHGRRCFEYLFGRSEPCETCETYSVLKTMAPHEWEWTGPDGNNYDVFDFPFTDTDASTLILEMGIDITERKEAQKRIETTNALLSLFVKMRTRKDYLDGVLELVQNWCGCRCAGIRVLDAQGNIPYESYTGFSREFWESENFLSVRNDHCVCIRVITGEMDRQDIPVMTPAGSFCCGNTIKFIRQLSEREKKRYRGVCVENGFLSVAVIPICYGERILGAIHLADETENRVTFKSLEFIESMAPLIGEAVNRFNLEEELKDSEIRLRHLSSQLLTVQENERKRISREIHDSLGQSLSAIKFKTESITQQMRENRYGKIAESLEAILPIIQESIEESRRIQMDLRPSILDDLGIIATLNWFSREFQNTYSDIHVDKKIDIQENEVPDTLKTVIYRISQEALNNIAKHSSAALVQLSLGKKGDKIELIIVDNGMGFDLESSKRGLGLTSMRERAELSGGSFFIESAIGKGTTIRASWPI